MKVALIGVAVAAIAVFLAFDTVDSRRRLQSLIGIGVLLSFGFVFSAYPTKVSQSDVRSTTTNWGSHKLYSLLQIRLRPVISGFACQLLLGLLCIRWEVGRNIFKCFGDKAATFLNFSIAGSTFVYGYFLSVTEGVFAFAVGLFSEHLLLHWCTLSLYVPTGRVLKR